MHSTRALQQSPGADPECRSRMRYPNTVVSKLGENQNGTLARNDTVTTTICANAKVCELSYCHIKIKQVFGRLPNTEFAREGKYQGFWEVGKGVGDISAFYRSSPSPRIRQQLNLFINQPNTKNMMRDARVLPNNTPSCNFMSICNGGYKYEAF